MNYLLFGQNGLAIDERIERLRRDVDPSGLNATTIDVQSSSLQEIAAACHATPFFGGQRIVVLDGPIARSKRSGAVEDDADQEHGGQIRWPDLFQILSSSPTSTVLIVRHDGGLAPGHHVRKALQPPSWTAESFVIPRGPELLDWVSRRAGERGVRVDPRAAQLLLERLYPTVWEAESRFDTITPDMRQIATEIEKLCCAAEDGTVNAELVAELVADRSGYKAFALNGAVFEGRVNDALIELAHLIEAGEAPERILAQLSSEVAGLAGARWSQDFGAKVVAAAAGISEGRISVLRPRAAGIGPDGLRFMAESLRNVESAVKTGRTAETSAMITPLVAGIAEVARVTPGAGRRRT